ncbi:MAG TPA: nucleotidyltransferase family protein [Bacteroidota bacterium]|nr:nucleotidyltransferase family protein [Bacteroidota bacterium]
MANPSVAIIILAAGASRRMRLPKQLLPFRRKNLLQYTIDEAAESKASTLCIVLGASADEIRKSIRVQKGSIVMNDSWPEGMSSSIRMGIASLPSTIDAAIISLCDQPHLKSSVFNQLMDAFVSSGKSIVASEYDGSPGVPALFANKHFPELSALSGDSGARKIIDAHRGDVELVSFEGGSVDLDTPEEYRQFIVRKFER